MLSARRNTHISTTTQGKQEYNIKIERSPNPDWNPLPRPNTVGVEVRVHLVSDTTFVAQLRFSPHATIDEHPGERSADIVCLAGEGFVSLGNETSAFRAGDQIFWPAGIPHRLWTQDASMETLMVERLDT